MNNPSLILASASAARQNMLRGAGLEFDICPADIDETAIIESLSQSESNPQGIAIQLAMEKALHVSHDRAAALTIGSDQILEHDGQIFEKAQSIGAAKEKLQRLRGQTHRLISAVSIAQDGKILWSSCDEAHLTMHNFTDEFLDEYTKAAGQSLISCVGAYALEKSGSWLFSDIKGDYFTILGMPLLPLLRYLTQEQGFKP